MDHYISLQGCGTRDHRWRLGVCWRRLRRKVSEETAHCCRFWHWSDSCPGEGSHECFSLQSIERSIGQLVNHNTMLWPMNQSINEWIRAYAVPFFSLNNWDTRASEMRATAPETAFPPSSRLQSSMLASDRWATAGSLQCFAFTL